LAILIATLFGPISARADTDLVIGGQARIAYANGDDVRLRESPAFNGTLIRYIPEGSVVDVLDGPAEGDEGSLWFEVAFDGDMGYVVSDYLALLRGEDEVAANSVVAADAGDVVGSALIANTSNDGVRCRTEPSSGGAVITVVPEGTWVELTGASAGGWQPINCGGQSGFVSDRYVSYDGSGTDNVGDGNAVGAQTAEAGATFGAASATGAATVSGTNGDGVNCRSSASTSGNVITILSEGSNVSLRGDPRGDWQPVICAGSNGYVSSQFLDVGDGTSDGGSGDAGGDDATGEAVVDGTNGDGVNCRTRARANSSVIVILPEGADVTLRGGASDGWQPVFCGGSQGFVSSQYLSTGGGGGGGGDDDGDDGGSGEVTGEATVTGTGNGLRCRSRASFDSSVITVLFDGDGVSLRGNVSGDWQPVVCSGSNGFVFADYLDYAGSGGGDDGGDGGSGPFAVGATVVVDGTNGDGVRLRSSASANGSIVMVVAEGQTATVISGSTNSWVAVTYKSTSGFISATYLAASSGGGGGDDGGDDDGGGSGGLSVGDNARTTADLNLRYDPRMSAGVAAVAPSGTIVRITGGASSGFYAVDWDGLSGYMSGDYLRYTDEDATDRGGSGDDDGIIIDEPDDNGGGSSGSAIVDYAMQYVGYPYVWATHGPSSFDCSGFTYWVVLNTLGVNISPGTAAQINYGTPISRGSIQPGDLIFFQNTYTWGLSHVGIYIGGGKFVHAENESTGVVVSDLAPATTPRAGTAPAAWGSPRASDTVRTNRGRAAGDSRPPSCIRGGSMQGRESRHDGTGDHRRRRRWAGHGPSILSAAPRPGYHAGRPVPTVDVRRGRCPCGVPTGNVAGRDVRVARTRG
jgi:N-acetylmuramoyl-L-alanine amidase